MRKRNFSQRIFIFPLAIVLLVFSFKDHVYSKSESNHDDRGYKSIALDTSTDRIFAVKEEKGIDVIDIKTGDITNTILLNKEIKAIAIDEQRKILAVAEEKTIQIISIDTYQVLSSIPVKEEPKALSIDSELGLLLIADEEDRLAAIDLNTYQKIKEIKIQGKPVSIAIDPQLKVAVIAHNTWGRGTDRDRDRDRETEKDRDNITVIDLTTFSIIKTLQAGKDPIAVAINPSTHEAAIANEKSNDITIIDLNSLKNEIAAVDRPRNDIIKGILPSEKHPKALTYNTCLNTLAVIGGEDKAWMQVIDMNTWNKKASYSLEDKIQDIKVHPYLNKAIIAGENGLDIISLPNPVPQLTSVIPAKALRGEKSFNFTLTGSGLLEITNIYLNGSKASSAFIQCGTIEVQVPEEYLKTTGDIEIKAINPTPEGGTSNPVNLQINNPVPSVSAIDPLETKTNIQSLILTIYGAGFFPDTEIYFGNIKKPITYISPIKLQINLTYEDLKTAGEYEIKAYNLPPGGGYSNKAIFTIKPSLEITITLPADGDTINKAKTIVRGTFKSDTKDIGITVNGILAEVTGNDWIANNIPLAIGANTITATIKDSEGNIETTSITINTNDISQAVTLSANITSGIAPLQVFFSASTETLNPITSYQMDFEGDGGVDYTGATFEDINHTYTTEGIFYPTITVTDDQGNTYSDTIAITVLNKAEIDTLLKGKWEGMKGEMAEGNIEKALKYIAAPSQNMYRYNFELMSSLLPTITQDMGNITLVKIVDNLAEYEMTATQAGQTLSFYVEFVKDTYGIWKIKFY